MTQPTKRKHVLKMQEWFELISENSSFVSSKLNLPCLLLCKTWHSSFSPFSPPSLISKYLKDILVSKLNALSTCRMRHKHVSLGLFSKLTNDNFWTVRCHWCFWTDRCHVENNWIFSWDRGTGLRQATCWPASELLLRQIQELFLFSTINRNSDRSWEQNWFREWHSGQWAVLMWCRLLSTHLTKSRVGQESVSNTLY